MSGSLHLETLVVTVESVARVPDRYFEVHRLVAELLVDHRGIHDRGEQEELFVSRVGGLVDRHRRFHLDFRRRHFHVVADLGAYRYQ